MTTPNQPPKIPWWASYWTGPATTRSNLRQEAWLFFLMAAAFLGAGLLRRSTAIGRPDSWDYSAAAIIISAAFTAAWMWQLIAASWIDRHQAWDRLATSEEREADQG